LDSSIRNATQYYHGAAAMEQELPSKTNKSESTTTTIEQQTENTDYLFKNEFSM
jgi:hypothetical protein